MFLSKKIFLLLFFYSFISITYSQLDGVDRDDVKNEINLFFDGKISDYHSGEEISGVIVTATAEGSKAGKGFSDGKGKYQLVLDFDKKYTIKFSKSGYLGKVIIINTKGVPEDKKFKCPDMFSEITLFKPNDCIKKNALEKPIGKARYFPEKNRIDWDMTYSTPIISSLSKMLDDCDKQQKKEEEKEREYDKIMKAANKNFEKGDWKKATSEYKKALALFPEKIEPQDKLQLIENQQLKKSDEKAKKEAEEIAKKAEQEKILNEKKEADIIAKQQREEAILKAKQEQEAQKKTTELAKQEEKRLLKEAENAKKLEKEQKEAKQKAQLEQEKAAELAKQKDQKSLEQEEQEKYNGEIILDSTQSEAIEEENTSPKSSTENFSNQKEKTAGSSTLKFKKKKTRFLQKKKNKFKKGKGPQVKKRMPL